MLETTSWVAVVEELASKKLTLWLKTDSRYFLLIRDVCLSAVLDQQNPSVYSHAQIVSFFKQTIYFYSYSNRIEEKQELEKLPCFINYQVFFACCWFYVSLIINM